MSGGSQGATPRRLTVHTDGGARGNPGPGGYGAVVTDAATGAVLAERAAFLGSCTNNVAEYEGLLAGLRAAAAIDPGALVEVKADSKLVVEQMSGRWKIKHPDMQRLALAARDVLPARQVRYTWVPRKDNAAADALANQVMDSRGELRTDAWRDGAPAGTGADTDRSAVRDDLGGHSATATPRDTPSDVGPGAGPDAVARPLHSPLGRPEGEPATLILVRHGVTPATLGGLMAGGDDAGLDLTGAGRAQAGRAATIVARAHEVFSGVRPPSELRCSPTVRTRSTAAVLGERLGLTARVDERLLEVKWGEWNGLPAAEVQQRWGGDFDAFVRTGRQVPPGGESLAMVGDRVGALLADVARTRAGRTVVGVSHSVAIRAAVGHALRADLGSWWLLRVPPASVTVLRLWDRSGADPGAPAPDERPFIAEVAAVGVPGELLP